MNIAIIMAGGIGKRMNSETPKQFLPLHGRPVILYSLETFQHCPEIDAIAVVCAEGYIGVCQKICRDANITKLASVVPGGKERYDSSRAGVQAASEIANGTDAVVLIHDAARPFVTEEIIAANIAAAKEYGACETAVEMTDTVISGRDGFTAAVVPREGLYRVQTPQSFRLSVISEAFEGYDPERDGPVTDDATLVLKRGLKVAIVKGSAANVKITTPEDLEDRFSR